MPSVGHVWGLASSLTQPMLTAPSTMPSSEPHESPADSASHYAMSDTASLALDDEIFAAFEYSTPVEEPQHTGPVTEAYYYQKLRESADRFAHQLSTS